MLGRQQIAGIPTAISELFKNAHDAYATRVEADLLRSEGLFLLRDNGLGMSRDDFEARWLTLGTESKLNLGFGLEPPARDPDQSGRPVLGEKGIGRLAIAAIGPQVLVLTRAKLSETGELVIAFVHWGMFDLPGVDLEEIEVPVDVMPGGNLPDAARIRELVGRARTNVARLEGKTDPDAIQRIEQQLASFSVDPASLDHELAGSSLANTGHGTHFYIQPIDESLTASIQSTAGDDVAPPLIKLLIGFTNTMTPDHPTPRLSVAFHDHKTDDLVDDLIADSAFFTPEEFGRADHHIEGRFDEYGQFTGTVTVYGEPTEGHVVPWRGASGRVTDCGSFRINLAVVQGTSRESAVPLEEWNSLIRKMNRIGGLYIYKDGIRVLPYGNNDYDFLDIERNRTKSASYYYFSYRRMFGVIEIDRVENVQLKEKAGREGFRENRAYRQFRDILMNFFIQLAADFFRDDSASDRYLTRRSELDRIERARRERDRLVTSRRQALRQRLEVSFAALDAGEPGAEVARVIQALQSDLASVADATTEDAAAGTLRAEAAAQRGIRDVEEKYRVAPPRGVGLPKALRRDVDAWRLEYTRLGSDVIEPARREIEEMVNAAARESRASVDRRMRFDRALDDLSERARKSTRNESTEAREAAKDAGQRVAKLARDSIGQVERALRDVLSRAARLEVSALSDAEFVAQRSALEAEIEAVTDEERRVLTSVAEQLRGVTWRDDDAGMVITGQDLDAAMEEEVLALRERSEQDLELAQLGMAIQVINHEFEATIRTVRSSLRELRAWADANEGLQDLYGRMRNSFDHLDGYLTMFTPLQRRLYRTATRITGAEIGKFVAELFEQRLRRHEISLQVSSRFRRHSIVGYPSTFYPIFVNLIDNAIFWLSQSPQPRWLRLDAKDGAMTVSDSGPGIAERDREAIFELGFTRRPGGRGMGLRISRDVLSRENYELLLQDPVEGRGATFRISPNEEAKG
jgi:signal transduction histidine kinase